MHGATIRTLQLYARCNYTHGATIHGTTIRTVQLYARSHEFTKKILLLNIVDVCRVRIMTIP